MNDSAAAAAVGIAAATAIDFATLDVFSDEVLADPFPTYAAIRDAGAAVWLARHQVWAVGRYADVRSVLMKHTLFRSGEGLSLTPQANQIQKGSVLASDPPEHGVLRGVLNERLSPSGLKGLAPSIQDAAHRLIGALVARGSFDAVEDLAKAFPVSIVLDLIGVPHEVRPKLMGWADAMFNSFGPPNERTIGGLPQLQEMSEYLFSVTPAMLTPGGLGAAVYEAGSRGILKPQQCAVLLGAYLGAGLDTTMNSISAAVALFASHPDQWQLLRRDPTLVGRAFDEVLRLESPVLSFSRVASADLLIDDVSIHEGDRVLVGYASANRDPRKWDEPDRFDITRPAADHLAFGHGRHVCAGQGLARLEAESVLRALALRVARIETATPVRHLNNVIRGLASLPTRVLAA